MVNAITLHKVINQSVVFRSIAIANAVNVLLDYNLIQKVNYVMTLRLLDVWKKDRKDALFAPKVI